MKTVLYYLVFAVWYLLSLLPWWILYGISDLVLYPLVRYVVRYRCRLVRESIATSFPEKGIKELEAIEREFYHWFCDYIVELIKHMSMSVDDIDRHMHFEGVEQVEREFMESDKAMCVFYLGHFNNWEWVSLLGSKFDRRHFLSQVYHPLHNKVLDRIFTRNREKCGTRNVAMKETLRVIVTQVRAGRKIMMGFIADQRPKTIHHWMPWLNHDTPVITGAETIGQKVGAVYYYVDVRRVRRGYYRATFHRLPEEGEGQFPITEHYMRMMEASIKADPAHWLWTHNRWKYKRTLQTFAMFAVSAALALASMAIPAQAQPVMEHDSVGAEFFANRLHTSDVVPYLQGISPHTVYQGNHTGRWSDADGLIFSVDGQSYRQNRYYMNGMRTNLRLTSGMSPYLLNMENQNLRIDPLRAALHFTSDTLATPYLSLGGNFGNLGGINPTTEGIVHLFHGTGVEGLHNAVTEHARQHVRVAGTMDVATDVGGYRQRLLVHVGSRSLPCFDVDGQSESHPLYTARYFQMQLDGALPAPRGFSGAGYFATVKGKDDGYSEYGFNKDEQPQTLVAAFTLYGQRSRAQGRMTTGLTWGLNRLSRSNPEFSRNLADQDGEALEPWISDGTHHELSWALTARRNITPWLSFKADAWNSLVAFSPRQKEWSNLVYLQHCGESTATALYRYEWQSRSFAGALLENTFTLEAQRSYCQQRLRLKGEVGMSLDGMLLRSNSKVTPNLEALLELEARPWQWLTVGVQLQHSRMTYNVETMRYMSSRYQNGTVYATSATETRSPEKADYKTLLTTTGGSSHHYASHLWQPSYFTLSIPIRARFGRHEILALQLIRKYYHTWHTSFSGGADAQGTWSEASVTPEMATEWGTDRQILPVYYVTPRSRDYEIGYLPSGLMGKGLKSSPYYLSQITQYAYHGSRLYFSLSWHSMIGASVSPLGTGPAVNDFGSLSETTALPATLSVLQNLDGKSPAVGRTDQDRAYIARIVLLWNATKHFAIGGTASWTDGQPIQLYRTFLNSETTSSAAHRDVSILPLCTRGINPTDGNFGCRESAIFHIDLHARLAWRTAGHDMQLTAQSYNIYDFGNVLTEYCFAQGYTEGRGDNLLLTIPRGLLLTYTIKL